MNKNQIVRSMIAVSNGIAASRTLSGIRDDLRIAASLPDTPMREALLNELWQDATMNIAEIERVMRSNGPVETV